MPQQTLQPSFAAGEIDPKLYQRIDLAKYHIGARTMLNWYVHASGGASNRPGTGWVGEILDSSKAGRLIPFQFSISQTYVLEFGDLKVRFITNGGYILESTKAITAVTKANPGVVSSTAHGFVTGDRVYLASIGGMTQLNRRYVTVTRIDANSYSVGVDTSGFTTYTSGGTAARLYTLVTPYAYADLPLLKYEQSADTLTLTHKSYAPQKLNRLGVASWQIAPIVFAPTQSAPTGVASNAGGSAAIYAVTAINDTSGEESLQSADAGSSSQTSTLTWPSLVDCSSYSVYKKKDGVYGFIGAAQAPASGGTVSFTDATIVPDKTTTPPQQRNPFAAGVITSITVTAAGSGYSGSPTLIVQDSSGLGNSVILVPHVSGGAFTSVDVTSGGKGLIAPTIVVSDGAGAGAVLALGFTPDGGEVVVGSYVDPGTGDTIPVTTPTYYISSCGVSAGGSGYHSGVQIRLAFPGEVSGGGAAFSATVSGGVITGVTVTAGGGGYYNYAPTYFPTAYTIDSAGTGAVLTPVLTNDTTVNPGCTTYHDGRQWFADTTARPQTLWASVSAAFNNMSVSIPTRDSDAITRNLASRQVNDIKHMISLTQLILLTGGSEWKVSAGSADVITPAQFVARPQSYNGSSDIRPIVVNNTLLYIPSSRRKVRSLDYQWAADVWTGTDLSLLAAHLFEASGTDGNQIVNWQFARDPESICWAVRDDGVLLGFTYLSEQQVYAWHRHTTSNGLFEDVCCVQEGDETAVYFIVNRTIDGVTKRYVERLHTRVFETLADAWFLDCGLEYDGSATTTISGLWHLIGESVYALADGVPVGPFTVSAAGTITLATAASKVIVGKAYPDCDLETLSIETQDQAGPSIGRKKKVNHVTLGLKNSADKGLTVGPSGGQGNPVLYEIKGKDMVNPLATPAGTAPALITDLMHMIAAPEWSWTGRTLIRATQPLPYTVTGVMADVTTG